MTLTTRKSVQNPEVAAHKMEGIKIEIEDGTYQTISRPAVSAVPAGPGSVEGDRHSMPPPGPQRTAPRHPGPVSNIFDSPILLPMMPVSINSSPGRLLNC